MPSYPGLRQSAQDIIKGSLRLLGVLDAESGENPSASMAQDGLEALNQMLDVWNSERLMVFTITRFDFPLLSGKQVYTCGVGGDFNMPRPPRIEYAYIISLTNPSQPLELLMDMYTDAEWASIPVKNITSSLPTTFYDDGAYPLRNLSYYPIPNAQVNTALWCWTTLSQFTDLTTQLAFPPGYAEAVKYNLAVRLAPEYGKDPSVTVAAIAGESKAKIKGFNVPIIDLRSDPALLGEGGHYNWLSDQYVGGRN